MKLTIDFSDFKPWSGAVDTWERIEAKGKIDELESVLDEIYPEGMSNTELNDLLWFEPETVFEWLGMLDEEEDEEEDDEDEDKNFDMFCSHFGNCCFCPLESCHSINDCESVFINHKDVFLQSIDNSNAESNYYDKSVIDAARKEWME